MADPFAHFISEARAFLSALSQNNSRDWFQAEKPRYVAQLKQPAELLLEQVRPALADLSGAEITPKLFRPHRDVRFSKDKTPYHTHLHLLWTEANQGPGWFLGIAPDYVTAGCGVMGLAKERLVRYRAAVDGPHGVELAAELARLEARMDAPELKRVPAPYDKDHARAELLRRKSLAVWRDDLETPLSGDVAGKLLEVYCGLSPVADWLRAYL